MKITIFVMAVTMTTASIAGTDDNLYESMWTGVNPRIAELAQEAATNAEVQRFKARQVKAEADKIVRLANEAKIASKAKIIQANRSAKAKRHSEILEEDVELLNAIQAKPAIDIFADNLYTAEDHPNEYCLALNVYYEARDDNLAGQYAVADVVLNRVRDDRFPDTVCGVVYQSYMYESWKTERYPDLAEDERIYYPIRNKCQFSWFCDGRPDEPQSKNSWRKAQLVAYYIYNFDRMRGISEGATHYHATYVTPQWSFVFDPIGRIGAHLFYRNP